MISVKHVLLNHKLLEGFLMGKLRQSPRKNCAESLSFSPSTRNLQVIKQPEDTIAFEAMHNVTQRPQFVGLAGELGMTSAGVPIQAKMVVGEAGDRYEQEADRLAPLIVRQINAPGFGEELQDSQPDIQEETPSKQLQTLQPTLQLKGESSGGAVSPAIESTIVSAKGGGQPLEPGLQERFGQAMGADFSKVRVHTNARANALNQSVGARAFTTKQDLFFKRGEYQPGSRGGQELIAHELTHVIQQSKDNSQICRTIVAANQVNDYIQFAPWRNADAKFRTDNEIPSIPNSEYLVWDTGYRRYAPVNFVRAPGQVYHEGPRSFAYVASVFANSPAVKETHQAIMGRNDREIILKAGDGVTQVRALKNPANGLTVWDADVDDQGNLTGSLHVGHAVENLGEPLPTLDDPQEVELAKSRQKSVDVAQYLGHLYQDDVLINHMISHSDEYYNGDDEQAMKAMLKNDKIGPRIRTAYAKGTLNFEFLAEVRRFI